MTAQCGTRSGYNRHIRNGEPACDDCRVAANAYERARQTKRRGGPPRPHQPYGPVRCGTDSGYTVHLRKGEVTCEACRAAHNAACKEYMARRRGELGSAGGPTT